MGERMEQVEDKHISVLMLVTTRTGWWLVYANSMRMSREIKILVPESGQFPLYSSRLAAIFLPTCQ